MERTALAFAAVALCASLPLSAQRVQRRVYVAATSEGSGTPVVNLAAGEFLIRENGVSREVLRATRGTGPMRIALVVDSSGEMATLLNSLRAGLTAFLDALPGAHELILISTGGQLRIRQPVTTDRQKLKTAAGLFASDGGANSLIETLIEADRRFLNAAPGQWPVFVIVTTDNGVTIAEPNIDRFNRFVREFARRGGTAHAIVMHNRASSQRITTQFVLNVVQNTGGFFDSIALATALPAKMKMLAEHIDANHQAMFNWYEVEFTGDGGAQSPRVEVDTTRDDVSVQMSVRRPF